MAEMEASMLWYRGLSPRGRRTRNGSEHERKAIVLLKSSLKTNAFALFKVYRSLPEPAVRSTKSFDSARNWIDPLSMNEELALGFILSGDDSSDGESKPTSKRLESKSDNSSHQGRYHEAKSRHTVPPQRYHIVNTDQDADDAVSDRSWPSSEEDGTPDTTESPDSMKDLSAVAYEVESGLKPTSMSVTKNVRRSMENLVAVDCAVGPNLDLATGDVPRLLLNDSPMNMHISIDESLNRSGAAAKIVQAAQEHHSPTPDCSAPEIFKEPATELITVSLGSSASATPTKFAQEAVLPPEDPLELPKIAHQVDESSTSPSETLASATAVQLAQDATSRPSETPAPAMQVELRPVDEGPTAIEYSVKTGLMSASAARRLRYRSVRDRLHKAKLPIERRDSSGMTTQVNRKPSVPASGAVRPSHSGSMTYYEYIETRQSHDEASNGIETQKGTSAQTGLKSPENLVQPRITRSRTAATKSGPHIVTQLVSSSPNDHNALNGSPGSNVPSLPRRPMRKISHDMGDPRPLLYQAAQKPDGIKLNDITGSSPTKEGNAIRPKTPPRPMSRPCLKAGESSLPSDSQQPKERNCIFNGASPQSSINSADHVVPRATSDSPVDGRHGKLQAEQTVEHGKSVNQRNPLMESRNRSPPKAEAVQPTDESSRANPRNIAKEAHSGRATGIKPVVEYYGRPESVSDPEIDVDKWRIQLIVRYWNSVQWGEAECYLGGHLESLIEKGDLESARRVRHLLGVAASLQGNFTRAIQQFLSVLRTPITDVSAFDEGDCIAAYWLADTYALLNRRTEALVAYCIAERGALFTYWNDRAPWRWIELEQDAVRMGLPMSHFKIHYAEIAEGFSFVDSNSILDPAMLSRQTIRLLLETRPRLPENMPESGIVLRPDKGKAALRAESTHLPLYPSNYSHLLHISSDSLTAVHNPATWPARFDPYFCMANVKRRFMGGEVNICEVFRSHGEARVPVISPFAINKLDFTISRDLNWLVQTIRQGLNTFGFFWSEVVNEKGTWFRCRYSLLQVGVATYHYFSLRLWRTTLGTGYGVEICSEDVVSARILKRDYEHPKGVHHKERQRLRKMLKQYLDEAATRGPDSQLPTPTPASATRPSESQTEVGRLSSEPQRATASSETSALLPQASRRMSRMISHVRGTS